MGDAAAWSFVKTTCHRAQPHRCLAPTCHYTMCLMSLLACAAAARSRRSTAT